MTDAQCTAIVAAVLTVAERATEDAERARGRWEDWHEPTPDAEMIHRAADLLDTAKAYFAPAEREAARQQALRRALEAKRGP